MLGDLLVVLGDLDLEGGTTGSGGDDGDASTEGFRNSDFKTSASEELRNEVGAIQESVHDCTRAKIDQTAC